MALIKIKNFLRLADDKRQAIWDQLRDEPALHFRVYARDIIPLPPIVRYSVGAYGLAQFLFGDDPGPVQEEVPTPAKDAKGGLTDIIDAIAPDNPPEGIEERRAADPAEAMARGLAAIETGKFPKKDRRKSPEK